MNTNSENTATMFNTRPTYFLQGAYHRPVVDRVHS